MNLKKGTPAFGVVLGIAFVVLGALDMLIGFWKTLVLFILFMAGYFLGSVDNKREFIKSTANKLIPEKEIKVIDFKSELKREQELSQAADETAGNAKAKTKE